VQCLGLDLEEDPPETPAVEQKPRKKWRKKPRNDAGQPLPLLKKAVREHGIRGVSRMIGTPEATVRYWIHKGNIPAKHVEMVTNLENMG
jgi:hypothetical protein